MNTLEKGFGLFLQAMFLFVAGAFCISLTLMGGDKLEVYIGASIGGAIVGVLFFAWATQAHLRLCQLAALIVLATSEFCIIKSTYMCFGHLPTIPAFVISMTAMLTTCHWLIERGYRMEKATQSTTTG